jgi:hypothetical protein
MLRIFILSSVNLRPHSPVRLGWTISAGAACNNDYNVLCDTGAGGFGNIKPFIDVQSLESLIFT